MEKFAQKSIYNLKEGIVDKENKCVRIPVNLTESKWIDTNLSLIIDRDLEIMFPDLKGKFTGKWDTKLDGDTVKEYIFFYE